MLPAYPTNSNGLSFLTNIIEYGRAEIKNDPEQLSYIQKPGLSKQLEAAYQEYQQALALSQGKGIHRGR